MSGFTCWRSADRWASVGEPLQARQRARSCSAREAPSRALDGWSTVCIARSLVDQMLGEKGCPRARARHRAARLVRFGQEGGMDYERKFAGLLQLCEEARSGNLDVIVIHHPEVLGDTYDELIESLNRIADC